MASERQRYSISDAGPITKDSQTYATILTLIFTPEANRRYALFVSCLAGPTESNGTGPHLRLRENSITRAELVCDKTFNNERTGFTMLYVHTEGAAPVSRSFTLDVRSTDSGFDIVFQDYSIIAIRLEDGNDGDQYATDDSTDTNDTETYGDHVSLIFTPDIAGDYLVIGYAEFGVDNGTTIDAKCRMVIAGGGLKPLYNLYTLGSGEFWHYFNMDKRNLAASVQTMSMQFAGAHSATRAAIRRSRILALRLDNFFSNEYAENSSQQTQTTSTYEEHLNLNFTANKADYLILATHFIGDDETSGNNFVESRIQKDNANWLSTTFSDRWNRAGFNRSCCAAIKIEELAVQTYDYDIDYRMGGGTGTASCLSSTIAALQLSEFADPPPEGARLLREFANDQGRLERVAVREFPR